MPGPASPTVPSLKPFKVKAAGLRICSFGPLVGLHETPGTRFGRLSSLKPVPAGPPLSPLRPPVVKTEIAWPEAAATMPATSQSPNTFRTKPDLFSRLGRASTRLALKMCRRAVFVGPEFRVRLPRAGVVVLFVMPPPSSRGILARGLDHGEDARGAFHAFVGVPPARLGVGVEDKGLLLAFAADIAARGGRVAQELVLAAHVPLPGVGEARILTAPAGGRAGADAEAPAAGL